MQQNINILSQSVYGSVIMLSNHLREWASGHDESASTRG